MAATPSDRGGRGRRASRFSLHEYEHDPRAASYGDEAAEKLDVDPRAALQDARRLGRRRACRRLRPVTAQLDLKRLGKRARLADTGAGAERRPATCSGGTSPLGQRKRLPTHIDASALEHETILVNGGRRGLQLELDPATSSRLTDARSVHAR